MFKFIFTFFTLVAYVACERILLPKAATSHIENAFKKTSKPPPDELVSIRFALKHRAGSVDKLAMLVDQVSDPDSSLYGKYLSAEELRKLIAPKRDSIEPLMNFIHKELNAVKVDGVLTGDKFIHVLSRVRDVEKAFGGITMHYYENRRSLRRTLRSADSHASLPGDVADCVDVVIGISDFFLTRRSEKKIGQEALQSARLSKTFSNAPELLPVSGDERVVKLSVVPYCLNGMPMMNATHCGTGVIQYNISQEGLPDVMSSVPINACSVASVGVICEFKEILNAPFKKFLVTAQTLFSNGSRSSIGEYFAPNGASPSAWATPQMLSELYSVPKAYHFPRKGSQAVGSFEGQFFSVDDLEMFFDINAMQFDRSLLTVKGANNQSVPGGEASLDIQSVMSVGDGVPTTFWYVGGAGPAHGSAYILDWAMEMSATKDPPLSNSLSYGDTEQGYLKYFGNYSYIDRMEIEFIKLGARGVTVAAGAGDAGSTNVGEGGNDISHTDPDCSVTRPFYPSCSPHVLSVGATFASTVSTPFCSGAFSRGDYSPACGILGESVVSVDSGVGYTTGGGFSMHFSRPHYQEVPVSRFLNRTASLPPPGTWNPAGRGYPDVVALGLGFNIVQGGQVTDSGGTSASGPVVAGLISILNDHQLSRGKQPIGLPHKLFYSIFAKNRNAFNDVTVGSNSGGDFQFRGSNYSTFCPKMGYFAMSGWDAASGMGSLNVEAILKLLP